MLVLGRLKCFTDLKDNMGVEENLEPLTTFDSLGHSDYDYSDRHQETNRSPQENGMEFYLEGKLRS